ncbi:MAG TPA: hypothetical protein DCQ06_06740 [Myxococcales bacterium]|nr:hypothetical protein [Myxococcales bacterium]
MLRISSSIDAVCSVEVTATERRLLGGIETKCGAWIAVVCLVYMGGCQRAPDHGEFHIGPIAAPLVKIADHKLESGELPQDRSYLTYGVTPYLGVQETKDAFSPIAKWLSKELGVEIRFVLADSYDDLVERFVRKEIDLVQLSPLSYVVAKEHMPGLHLLGTSLSFGAAEYSSLLIVRADSTLREMSDLKGNATKIRFGYVHERSASGFLLPYDALLRNDIDPQRDLKMIRMGSHEHAVKALMRGQVDLAAVSSGTLNNVRRGVVIGVGNIRTFYKAGRLPYDAVCAGSWVSDSASQKITSAFASLSTRTSAGREVLAKARGVTGWCAATDERYGVIRKYYHRVRAERWRALGRQRAPAQVTPTGDP